MRVYMGTYAKYNAGNLFGAWLKLSDYVNWDDFIEAANKLHSDEEDPEFMAQDWEGPDWIIDEYGVQYKAWDYMDLSEDDQAIVTHLVENKGSSFEGALESLGLENFFIYDGALEDYAFDLLTTCYSVPDEVTQYLDTEKYARDLILNGDAELMGDYSGNECDYTRDDSRQWFMER